jgi:hypothetical protein
MDKPMMMHDDSGKVASRGPAEENGAGSAAAMEETSEGQRCTYEWWESPVGIDSSSFEVGGATD